MCVLIERSAPSGSRAAIASTIAACSSTDASTRPGISSVSRPIREIRAALRDEPLPAQVLEPPAGAVAEVAQVAPVGEGSTAVAEPARPENT